MSQENVELVRAAYEAWNRSDLEAALRYAHPDIEFVQDGSIPGAVAKISAEGKASGAEVAQRIGHVITLRDGQMVRWNSYAEPVDALEAVGLRE